jgi:hypothetical protein
MKISFQFAIVLMLVGAATCCAQRNGKDRNGRRSPSGAMSVPDNPQAVGETGVAWYTTWDTGLAEAKRSNRPILFMSAATTCSGVSGVF